LVGKGPAPGLSQLLAVLGVERREKMFGLGHSRALDRNAKVRIMHWSDAYNFCDPGLPNSSKSEKQTRTRTKIFLSDKRGKAGADSGEAARL
jgi:hypothetical protein